MKLVDVHMRAYGYLSIEAIETIEQQNREIRELKQTIADLEKESPEELAKKFHNIYEKLAPSFGYETRKASRVNWNQVPENNKNLMIAVCKEIVHK